MENDIINSNNTDYVMERIRKLYLLDSTVTIVLIGKCTWARKFVDWEIQSSLKKPANGHPNGLIAIQLSQFNNTPPNRVLLNIASGYTKLHNYPRNSIELSNFIEDAFNARFNKSRLIDNPRDRFINNREC